MESKCQSTETDMWVDLFNQGVVQTKTLYIPVMPCACYPVPSFVPPLDEVLLAVRGRARDRPTRLLYSWRAPGFLVLAASCEQ